MRSNENHDLTVIHAPELYHELLGIFFDLKVLVFAMHHQYDMPENDRGELAFTGDRIITRFENVVEKTSACY